MIPLATTLYRSYLVYDAHSTLSTATQCCKDARRQGSNFDILESTLATESSMLNYFNVAIILPNYLGYVGAQVMAFATEFLKNVSPFLTQVPLTKFLAFSSIVLGVLTIIKESLALARQCYFIRLFNQSDWKSDPVGTLENLKQKHPEFIKRSLPEWLSAKIERPKISSQEKREQGVMRSLLPSNLYSEPELPASELTPQEQMDKIHSYVVKKAFYHVLLIAAAVAGIVVSCATLGMPLLISLGVAMGIVIVLAVACYIYKEGVLNNPDGGFSFIRCIPEAVRNLSTNIKEGLVNRVQQWQVERDEYNQLITKFLSKK